MNSVLSIMFPVIFTLGIHVLIPRAKVAAAFILAASGGEAVLLSPMAAVGNHYGMSRAFVLPLVCFSIVAAYGFAWHALNRDRTGRRRSGIT